MIKLDNKDIQILSVLQQSFLYYNVTGELPKQRSQSKYFYHQRRVGKEYNPMVAATTLTQISIPTLLLKSRKPIIGTKGTHNPVMNPVLETLV